MGYVEKNLIAGEEVTYRGRLHWILLFWPVVIALLLGLPGIVMLYEGAFAEHTNMGWLIVPGIAMLFIAVVILLRGMWGRMATQFAVTNKRIIVKRGILERRIEEMLLQKIESISVDQGLLGRMLDYGTLAVRGTGGTLEPLNYVSHALHLRRQVQEQIARGR